MKRYNFSKARPCRIVYDYSSVPDKRFEIWTSISVWFEYEIDWVPVINDEPIVLAWEYWSNSKARKELIRDWWRIISELKKWANVYKKDNLHKKDWLIFKQINW